MSRIAIDIRPLADRHMTGVGFALLEALKELIPHASPAREYILFASGTEEALSRIPELPKNAHVRFVYKTIPNKFVMLWSLLRTDALDVLLNEPCDAWWFPHWTIISTKKPFALTVHDASFVHTPHFYPKKDRVLAFLAKPAKAAQRATQCIVVSEHTGKDICETWSISPAHIYSAPLGVRSIFSIREQPSDRSYRASHDLHRPYILSLATHEPRKNILGILEAYQAVKQTDPQTPLLVLGGTPRLRLPPELLEHVRVLGYIPAKHRPALMRGARALLFPSFNEGFGLPVLEALACGTPVVTSIATPPSSLFMHGIFPADPYNVTDIANALRACLRTPQDTQTKERLHAQTTSFTWEKHAKILEQTFQLLCSSRTIPF